MDVLNFCTAILLLTGYASATCRFPGAPAHSRVTFSDESLPEGAYAVYECERGFELLGPARRMCDPQGRWVPDGIPFCVLNVAAGKAPMHISTEEGGVPQRALDGSTAAAFRADTCTLTMPERAPWWYVNLLEPYMVQLVRLDFGKPCCDANQPPTIIVRVGNNRPDLATNPICNRYIGFIEEGQPLFLPCNPPMPGAFVSVHLESQTTSQLSLCEAFVYTDQALPIERCPQFRDQPPGGTATYNGKCYIFYDRQPATFQDALGFCRGRGGTLVDESNPALQGFISWELWRRHRSDNSSQYWMGAVRDARDPSSWKWVNGNDVTVSFWDAPGGQGSCARFDGSKGWLWTDTDCHSSFNYICQHQPKTCGRPEQPPNSTMVSNGFGVGSSVEYACDDGYLLVGPATRTCLDTGFYDEFPPVCKRIECGFPAVIANGGYTLLNGSVSYMSHVQYTCKPGYEMTGRSRLVCDIDERWNGPPPRCEAINCEEPPAIANGRATMLRNRTSFGTVAEYSCAAGHALRGAARLECLATGLWDQPPPACVPVELETTSMRTTSTEMTTITSRPAPSPEPHRPVPRRTSPRPAHSTPLPQADRPLRPRLKTTTTTTTTTERSTTRAVPVPPSEKKVTAHDSQTSPASHVPHIIVANRPRGNQIFGSGISFQEEHPTPVNAPTFDGERREPTGARLNTGVVVALAAFGALVFLIAIITTGVILCKGNADGNLRGGPGAVCRAAGSGGSRGSSETESHSGLTRYYHQNWEELHEATNAIGKHERLLHELQPPNDRFQCAANASVSDHAQRVFPRRHHHHHYHRREQPPVVPAAAHHKRRPSCGI